MVPAATALEVSKRNKREVWVFEESPYALTSRKRVTTTDCACVCASPHPLPMSSLYGPGFSVKNAVWGQQFCRHGGFNEDLVLLDKYLFPNQGAT